MEVPIVSRPIFDRMTSPERRNIDLPKRVTAENKDEQFQYACALYNKPGSELSEREDAVNLLLEVAEVGHAGAMAKLVWVFYTQEMYNLEKAKRYIDMAIAHLPLSENNVQLIMDQISTDLPLPASIAELMKLCTAYLHNQKLITTLPTENWFSIYERHLTVDARKSLAKTCRAFAFIEGSIKPLTNITLNLSKLKEEDEGEFRQYLTCLSGQEVEIRLSNLGEDRKWFQIFCDEVSKNKKITSLALDLWETDVKDVDLLLLVPLINLHSLNLQSTVIKDEGLLHLALCTQLRTLILSYTAITDAGLPHLAPLTQLTYLGLDWVDISDNGMPNLAPFIQLQGLSLTGTKITDDGLSLLLPFKQLRWLFLNLVTLTDAARPHLIQFGYLEILELRWVFGITDVVMQDLKTQLPACVIVR